MKGNNLKKVLVMSAVLGMSGLVATPAAHAQGGPQEVSTKVLPLMQNGKWAEALGLIDNCIKVYGNRLEGIGWAKRFGPFYYWKGLCELQLGKPQEAADSFRTCHEKFNFEENFARNIALIGIGEAEVKLQNYAKAREALDKFIKVHDRAKDRYNPATLYGNLAICCFMQTPPDLEKGYENLTLLAKNRGRASIPDNIIYPAFTAMVKGCISAKRPKMVFDFLKEYRSTIEQEAYRLAPYRAYLVKYAEEARQAGLLDLAYELLSLTPENDLVTNDAAFSASRLGEMKGIKDTTNLLVKEGLKGVENDIKSKRGTKEDLQQHALTMSITLHLANGSWRAARAGIDTLLKTYPELDPKLAEEMSFQQINLTSMLGDIVKADELAQAFIEKYPKSEKVDTVYQMTMMSLIKDGKFDKALEVSGRVLKNVKPKTKAHEMALYVNGIANFNLGHQEDAIKAFAEFGPMYPESPFLVPVEYFEASAYGYLRDYPKARGLLEAFLKKWSGDKAEKAKDFLPFANHDMAVAQYVLNNEEGFNNALKYIEAIESKWPAHQIYPTAMLTKGNVLKSKGDMAKAEEAYRVALAQSTEKKIDPVAAESLYALMGIVGSSQGGEEPRHAEAAKFYDEYFAKYDKLGMPYRLEGAVIGVENLEKVDRLPEAMERLQKLIVEHSRDPQTALGVEAALNSYIKKYTEKNSAEKAKDHFINFPGLDLSRDIALKALLRIGLIGVLEEEVRKSKDDQAKKDKAEALVRATFAELEKDFKPSDLSPYILVKLGNYLREKTEQPKRAIPYYKEAMNDKNKKMDESAAALALFGIADIYSKSTDKGEIQQSIDMLNKMMEAENDKTRVGGVPNKENINRGKFALLRSYIALQDYQKAIAAANDYLENVKGGRDRPQAMLLYAQALEGDGQVDPAIVQYNVVIGLYSGNVQLAAPSVKRMRDLLWARNKPGDVNKRSDRYMALSAEKRWVNGLKAAFEKMSVEERNMYREIAEQYEKDRVSPELLKEQEELDARAKAGR